MLSMQIIREFDMVVGEVGSQARFQQSWNMKWTPAIIRLAKIEGCDIDMKEVEGMDEIPKDDSSVVVHNYVHIYIHVT